MIKSAARRFCRPIRRLASRPVDGACAFNASKAGLEGFLRGLAMSWRRTTSPPRRRSGARSTRSCAPVGRGRTAVDCPAKLPLGRQGAPVRRSRRWCAILVGPEGRYITGQTIHVNGGLFFGKNSRAVFV